MGRFPALKRRAEPSSPYGHGPSGRKTDANRSWCQKVEQTSRVFQVQATGRFEVEDFAIRIRNAG